MRELHGAFRGRDRLAVYATLQIKDWYVIDIMELYAVAGNLFDHSRFNAPAQFGAPTLQDMEAAIVTMKIDTQIFTTVEERIEKGYK